MHQPRPLDSYSCGWPTALLLLFGGLPSCGPDEPSAQPDLPRETRAAYSETREFVMVEQSLGDLDTHGIELVQAFRPEDLRSPALRSLILASGARQIPFRAWITLPHEQGYWINESNLDPTGEAVDALLAWVAEEDLPVGWVTFDLEPAFDYSNQIREATQQAAATSSPDQLIELLASHVDPNGYEVARAKLQGIVERIHRAGLRAHAVTNPPVLDDLADGDTDLQDAFDTPVQGIDWDEVTFMVYRSSFADLGTAVTPELFYSYGLDAVAGFGGRAGLDFGIIESKPDGSDHGYTDPALMRQDVAQAKAAGILHLNLYSFERARVRGNVDAWLSFADEPAAVREDELAAKQPARVLVGLLDDVLDGGPER